MFYSTESASQSLLSQRAAERYAQVSAATEARRALTTKRQSLRLWLRLKTA